MTDEVDYVVSNDAIKTSNVVDALVEAIPEFREAIADGEREQTHFVFGRFAQFIEELIAHREESDAVLRRAFDFVNRLANIRGEMENLIDIEVIPVLAATEEGRAAGRELLAERPRSWLEQKIAAQ